jgi:hypothetical protein
MRGEYLPTTGGTTEPTEGRRMDPTLSKVGHVDPEVRHVDREVKHRHSPEDPTRQKNSPSAKSPRYQILGHFLGPREPSRLAIFFVRLCDHRPEGNGDVLNPLSTQTRLIRITYCRYWLPTGALQLEILCFRQGGTMDGTNSIRYSNYKRTTMGGGSEQYKLGTLLHLRSEGNGPHTGRRCCQCPHLAQPWGRSPDCEHGIVHECHL